MEKNKRNFLVLSFCLAMICSCGNGEMKPSELISWTENPENGLHQDQIFTEFGFEAQYKPVNYVVALEGRTDDLSENEYSNLKSELSGLQYIDLKIKTKSGNGNALDGNTNSEQDYYSRLDYFVMYADQDISLLQGQDTLKPVIYHFERNYGLAPYSTILLAFKKPQNEVDRTLLIDDQVLGVGKVKFQFKSADILNTPDLKRI